MENSRAGRQWTATFCKVLINRLLYCILMIWLSSGRMPAPRSGELAPIYGEFRRGAPDDGTSSQTTDKHIIVLYFDDLAFRWPHAGAIVLENWRRFMENSHARAPYNIIIGSTMESLIHLCAKKKAPLEPRHRLSFLQKMIGVNSVCLFSFLR